MWAIAFVTACVYTPPDDEGPGEPGGPGPSQTIAGACFAENTLLCLEFESEDMVDGLARDGSGKGNDATRIDVAEITRFMNPTPTDPGAAGFGPTSRMTVANELGLAGSVTVEMWSMGFANRKVFDSSGRFYLARNSDGQLECGINGTTNESVDGETRLDELTWHHVACVFDASSNDIKVFVDGDVDDCKHLDRGIDTSITGGTTTLGASFLGAIDSVHVFSRALTTDEICTSAGRTSCTSRCPSNGGQGSPGGFDD